MGSPSRTENCSRADALVRLQHARAFIEVAELVLGTDHELALPQVSASLAVLSGIAACDAVCCARVRQRSRGQSHWQAIELLRTVTDAPKAMTQDLRRLLDVKDGAHYSSMMVTPAEARDSVRRARRLYDAAVALVK